MNDRDMILMTTLISRSLFNFSLSLVNHSCVIYTSFSRSSSFAFFFSSGICSCILSVHTVDHWVVFDTIYTYKASLVSDYCNFYRVCYLYYGFSRL